VATRAQWVQGARPRTLPAALAPVVVGTGAAAAVGAASWRALLALVVSLALQVGVNYANDYSDGVKGTDTVRVGPLRLVGSGAATPGSVKKAAFAAFAVAAVAGGVLAAMSSWWLLVVGACAIAAAWLYTGGPRPYGYAGLGEVFVFVFFGVVAVCGTTFVQAGRVTAVAWVASVPVGLLACAILVANNLRDIPTDGAAGKRTLAVRIGDAGTRRLYAGMLVVPFVVAVVLALAAAPWALLALVAAPLTVPPLRLVAGGATGRDLIGVLRDTGRLQLAYAVALGIGLALS